MTMSSSVSKVTLNGDGVQTSWPFSFKVWKADDLEVSVTNSEGATTVVSNWSVVLAGTGGTVTYPTSGPTLPSGSKITIARSMDFLQDVDLVSGTRWDPEVMETALDKATAERQQLKEELSRAVKVDVSGTQTAEELKEDIFAVRDAAAASAGASASFAAAAAASADQAEAAAGLVGVLTASGTLPAGDDTITTPWAYNFEEGALSVYLGGVRQVKTSLTFIDAHTVQVGSTFLEDITYEATTVTLDGESTLTALRDDTVAAKTAAETARGDALVAKVAAELAEDGAQAAQLAAEAISTEAAARAYNYIINGNFDIWQRGTSQTSHAYGSDDRWMNGHVGSTKTHSRQPFSVGEIFPDGKDCPSFYSRTVVTSVAGVSNHCYKSQKIEFVSTLAGKKALLSFYAKASSSKSLSIEFAQGFGNGGSPSPPVYGIGVQKVELTTSWQRFSVVVDLPSIAGKVIGTNNNSNLQVLFWFDAGSNFNSRNDSLGHQSGTFDIAAVSLVEGDVDIKPIPRSYGEELALCQRYYAAGGAYTRSHAAGAGYLFDTPIYFPCMMRAVPVTTLTDGGGRLNVQSILLASDPWLDSTRHEIVSAGAGDCRALGDIWTADAEL